MIMIALLAIKESGYPGWFVFLLLFYAAFFDGIFILTMLFIIRSIL